MGYLELPSFLVNSFALFVIAYTGAGIAVYVALYRRFRKADFPAPLGRDLLPLEGLLIIWLFWPIGALLSVLTYRYLINQRKIRADREIARKSRGRYADMTMDELLAEQRKVLGSLEPPGK